MQFLSFFIKSLLLHRVFHSIRFKVNKVGIQRYPFFYALMSERRSVAQAVSSNPQTKRPLHPDTNSPHNGSDIGSLCMKITGGGHCHCNTVAVSAVPYISFKNLSEREKQRQDNDHCHGHNQLQRQSHFHIVDRLVTSRRHDQCIRRRGKG